MSFAQGNGTFKRRRIPDLKIPTTKAEFSKLGYNERVQLLEEHPTTYRKFAKPKKKPWEQD